MQQRGIFGKIIDSTDRILVALVMIASLMGIAAVFSATHSMNTLKMVIVQGGAFVIGTVAMLLISRVDYEIFGDASKIIYVASILLLVLVLFIGMGRDSTGTKGWIDLGVVSFQPSEFVKIGFILTFAKHLDRVRGDINYIPTLLSLALHMGILVFLILMQPDAGTAMVFIFIFISMMFAAGLSYKYLAIAFGAVILIAPLFWYFKDKILSPYQVQRFLVFFDPYIDPMGSGYNVIQSEISIGSGKLFGKGFLSGTQNQLEYLPAKHTDFIFATIGEEWGFIGAVAVVAILCMIIIRCVYIAKKAGSNFGGFICIGIGAMFAFHMIENIGMCIQLMPVTGIPLPFFSYGGSSLLTNLIAIGIVNSIAVRCRGGNFLE